MIAARQIQAWYQCQTTMRSFLYYLERLWCPQTCIRRPMGSRICCHNYSVKLAYVLSVLRSLHLSLWEESSNKYPTTLARVLGLLSLCHPAIWGVQDTILGTWLSASEKDGYWTIRSLYFIQSAARCLLANKLRHMERLNTTQRRLPEKDMGDRNCQTVYSQNWIRHFKRP